MAQFSKLEESYLYDPQKVSVMNTQSRSHKNIQHT